MQFPHPDYNFSLPVSFGFCCLANTKSSGHNLNSVLRVEPRLMGIPDILGGHTHVPPPDGGWATQHPVFFIMHRFSGEIFGTAANEAGWGRFFFQLLGGSTPTRPCRREMVGFPLLVRSLVLARQLRTRGMRPAELKPPGSRLQENRKTLTAHLQVRLAANNYSLLFARGLSFFSYRSPFQLMDLPTQHLGHFCSESKGGTPPAELTFGNRPARATF